MSVSPEKYDAGDFDPSSMPFAAPCNTLDIHAPFRWLRKGWQDILIAPKQSLIYGFVMTILSYSVAFLAYEMGNFIIMVALLSGFMFLGPVLAIGLYSISCQIQHGKKPVLGYCLREGRRHLGNEMVFAAILLVVFLLWMRATSVVHIFFPVETNPEWSDLAVFLGIGSLIGAVFSGIIFCASAFCCCHQHQCRTAQQGSIAALGFSDCILFPAGFSDRNPDRIIAIDRACNLACVSGNHHCRCLAKSR
jgi:uncharacterized membrane protein